MSSERQKMIWIWGEMIGRCTNPRHVQYFNYGGRGISVCAEWRKLRTFIADMSPRPDGMTLDRIDNNQGYSKSNCRWVSYAVQSLNKRLYKRNKCGISGVEPRDAGFRVRLRSAGKIVVNKTTRDFFEACCIRKSAEEEYMKPILEAAA